MKRESLLIVLVVSLLFFFYQSGSAQVNEYSQVPVDLQIGPGDSEVGSFNVYASQRGDATGDGKITVEDIIYLIHYLLLGGPPPGSLEAGDANCDGKASVSDIVYLINYLFKNGRPPGCYPTGFLVNHSSCKSFLKESTSDSVSTDQDCIEHQYDGQKVLLLKHINAGFNCCPDDLLGNVTIINNVITIEEAEVLSIPCHCLCLFDLTLEILNLEPGDYTIKVIEPYVEPDEEKLEFPISLSSTPSSGIHCVKRLHYPWGSGK